MKITKLFTTLMMLASISPQPRPVDAQPNPVQVIKGDLDTYKTASQLIEYLKGLNDNEVSYSYKIDASNLGVILIANEKELDTFQKIALAGSGYEKDWNARHQLCSLTSANYKSICEEWKKDVLECNGNCCYGSGYEEFQGLCYPQCNAKEGYYSKDFDIKDFKCCRIISDKEYREEVESIFGAIKHMKDALISVLFHGGEGDREDCYDRGEGKTPNRACASNNANLNVKEEKGKFYIGEKELKKEIKKWTQVTFISYYDDCKSNIDVLRSRFGDKNNINFVSIIDALSHFKDDRNTNCLVKREPKIIGRHVAEFRPRTFCVGTTVPVCKVVTEGACSIFLSTELVHHFVPAPINSNKKQTNIQTHKTTEVKAQIVKDEL